MSKTEKIVGMANRNTTSHNFNRLCISDIAARIGSTPQAAFRLLSTLCYQGKIEGYRVGQSFKFYHS